MNLYSLFALIPVLFGTILLYLRDRRWLKEAQWLAEEKSQDYDNLANSVQKSHEIYNQFKDSTNDNNAEWLRKHGRLRPERQQELS